MQRAVSSVDEKSLLWKIIKCCKTQSSQSFICRVGLVDFLVAQAAWASGKIKEMFA